MKVRYQASMARVGVVVLAGLLSGCTSTEGAKPPTTVVIREGMNELERDPVPGTVNDVWIEPMYDTVRVPGQLDPKGTYYRKAHNALVEVRDRRFQLVEFPNDRPATDEYVVDPNGTLPETEPAVNGGVEPSLPYR